MKIEVTQEDIDHGIKGDCDLCPIARAVHRHIPTARVGITVIRLNRMSFSCIDLPEEARNFIHLFDHGMKVIPFEFEVEVP